MIAVQKDFIQSKFRMELSLIDRWGCLQQSVYIARALETISYRIGTRPKAQSKEKLSQSKEKLNSNLTLRRLLAEKPWEKDSLLEHWRSTNSSIRQSILSLKARESCLLRWCSVTGAVVEFLNGI